MAPLLTALQLFMLALLPRYQEYAFLQAPMNKILTFPVFGPIFRSNILVLGPSGLLNHKDIAQRFRIVSGNQVQHIIRTGFGKLGLGQSGFNGGF